MSNLDIATLMAVLAIAGHVLSFLRFGSLAKERAVAEGKHLETIDQLRRDLDRAYEKIRMLEGTTNTTEGDIIEIKNDLKHIIKAIERMEKKFDSHIDGHKDAK